MNDGTQWTPVIAAHAAMAGLAILLGARLFAGVKGTTAHRVLGWAWVLLMAGVAISSFWIFRASYSWIHLLSVYTLGALAVAVARARRHDARAHRRAMVSLYVAALVVTGLFTLLPQRLLGQALWSALGALP